jgi:hypothetical protein
MAPNAPILDALATSCRMLSNSYQFQLADKRKVFEFHLEWLSLCVRYPNSASGEELTSEMQAQFDDLALRMAKFVVNRECNVAARQRTLSTICHDK